MLNILYQTLLPLGFAVAPIEPPQWSIPSQAARAQQQVHPFLTALALVFPKLHHSRQHSRLWFRIGIFYSVVRYSEGAVGENMPIPQLTTQTYPCCVMLHYYRKRWSKRLSLWALAPL